MMPTIPYGKQDITEADILAVTEALRSDYLTQGPRIEAFEQKFAQYVSCKFAVAVSNGTAALHLAAMALGTVKDDKVITPPITFAASSNCIVYCGAEVHFCDIDPQTYLIDIEKIRTTLAQHPRGTFKGIISVDFAGRAVDMEKLRELADEYGLWIIQDACHSPGGYFTSKQGKEEKCGNASFSDAVVFSFHPVKHIACGEGGMITTNREDVYQKLLMLRTHGITRNRSLFTNTVEKAGGEAEGSYPGWYMEMQTLGYNYRLTDFQAALGISQLLNAAPRLARRREIAQNYFSAFKDCDFIKGQSGVVEGHAYHLYVIETNDRLGLYNHLRKQGILAQVHYFPTHLMPYYKRFGWKEGDMPVSENYYKGCLSLPMYPTLTDNEQDYVINSIKNYFIAG